MWYVKTFCTHKDLGKFTVYFPYILLISALLLMSIERLINKIFKSKEQIEGFHSLLTQKNDNETVRVVLTFTECKMLREMLAGGGGGSRGRPGPDVR